MQSLKNKSLVFLSYQILVFGMLINKVHFFKKESQALSSIFQNVFQYMTIVKAIAHNQDSNGHILKMHLCKKNLFAELINSEY